MCMRYFNKSVSISILLNCFLLAAYSQSTDRNFVSKSDIKQPGITTQSGVDALTITGKIQQVGYFDGLGRPLQQVVVQGSPLGKDVITAIEYENGREVKKFLPYVDQNNGTAGSLRTTAYADQRSFYNPGNTSVNVARDSFPFIQTLFQFSPLGTPMENGAPGKTWQPGNGNTTKVITSVNTLIDSVKKWDVTDVAHTFGTYSSTNYFAGDLFKIISIDEHGKQVIEFKDREGKVVLKKVQLTATPDNVAGNGHTDWLCTYYIYDAVNHLRCVIQPRGVELISSSWTLTDATILAEQCFRYEYDERARMIMKKVPGSGIVYMLYDLRDRLVFTQDSIMRAKNWWMTTLYDGINRPVATGITVYTGTRAQLLAHLSDSINSINGSTTIQGSAPATNMTISNRETGRTSYQASSTIEFNPGFVSETNAEYIAEIITGSGSTSTVQRSGNPFPSGATFIALTLTYYDDYSFTSKTYDTANNSKLDYGNNLNPETLPAAAYQITKGLGIGSKVWVMEDPNTLSNGRWLETVTFYDDKGRLVQAQSDNHKGGKEAITTRYDFTGKPLCRYIVHTNPSAATGTIRIKTNMEYDNTGKLLTIKKQLNDAGTAKTVVTNEYDELGQLKNKKLGTALDSLIYDYNIRGWMLGANREYAKSSSNTSHYFGFDLGYDQTISTYASAQYNGNIGGTVWKSKGDNEIRKYDFNYDNVNRIAGADFNQYTGGTFNKTANVDFSVSNLTFDANGNILSMNQKGLKLTTSSAIDQLKYTYQTNSNKLQQVYDTANDNASKLSDFKYDGIAKTSTDYSYDPNGNPTVDNNKKISSITYIHHNLPSVITVTGKGTITYLYDAVGNKLQKKTVEGNTVTTNSYINGFVYQNDTLQFTAHEEGRIRYRPDSNLYAYDYFLKDHLGNIRVVLTDEQKTDAYPVASLETAPLPTERSYYSGVDTGRINKSEAAGYPTDTYTNPNDFIQKLRGDGHKVGTGIVLKVMAGDKFNLRANSWYKLYGATPGTPENPLTQLIWALSGGISSATPAKGTQSVLENSGVLSPGATDFLNDHSGNYNTARPKAFVNWLLFDEQFKLDSANSGFEQVGADEVFTTHTRNDMPVGKCGYLYIYLSNETPNVNVYFDNLQVTHTRGALLEESHFYPFGLIMSGISYKAAGGIKNKYKYNGKEEQREEFSDGSGLEWLDYGARMYDNQIARFNNIDPEAAILYSWSPFAYVRNNPILRIDPTGKWDVTVHVYNDREKYGYGIAIVTDRNGKEVFRMEVRAEGVGGRDRMVTDSDTPLGVYDIPNKDSWMIGGRKSYGPNYRLVLIGESGEIIESGRSDIRIHGGRQEIYDTKTKKWVPVEDPKLKKTHGCMRCLDTDIKKMKEITDELEKNDTKEHGGKLTVVDDLVEKNGEYVLPENDQSKSEVIKLNKAEIMAIINYIKGVTNETKNKK